LEERRLRRKNKGTIATQAEIVELNNDEKHIAAIANMP